MNAFIIDLTHGGVKIAIELSKLNSKNNFNLYENIYAYDLYNTLKDEDENLLKVYNISILKDFDDLKDKILNSANVENNTKNIIINPVHSSLDLKNILNENNINDSFKLISHHEAVKLILENWKNECEKQDVKTIEITGVKGKTTTSYLLKDVFEANEEDILLLSSLGAHLFRELGTTKKFRDLILQKNISITPASILSTVELAKKIANPKCSYQKCGCKPFEDLKEEAIEIEKYENNPYSNLNYNISIFESSLGISGLGDIGILTNIVENYPIAKGKSNAKEAKKQVFNSKLVVIDHDTLDEFYKDEKELYSNKINTFSLNNNKSNVFIENANYDINETKFTAFYNNLKTIDNNLISGKIDIKTFAPGKHHVANVLAAITTALSFNISEETIKEGLENFKGIPGRSSRKTIENSQIIEEINPGINTKA
ncbi:MAG: coenzyme F430 synthase, partial [Methanobacteriaceae archaeon]|nr:coenzyme F430 synthase [Methanobacteriaceae archaeon]